MITRGGVGRIGLLFLSLFSCNGSKRMAAGGMADSLFPKGEKITNNYFAGTAWLQSLIGPDSLNFTSVGSVTFEPGARTNWHYHPGGHILLATGGVGYYQERGSPKKVLRKGDAVKFPPKVHHWHGASPDQPFIQIAITNTQNGAVVWLNRVSEEEYADEIK